MNIGIFLALLLVGVLLLEINEALFGIIFIIAAVVFAFATILKKLFSGTKKSAKALARNIPEEIEKAEGQHPSKGEWEAGLKGAGELVGKQVFAPGSVINKPGKMDSKKWKFKGMSGFSTGMKKFADGFKKLMGM